MGLPWFRADTNIPTHDKILDLVGHGTKGKAAAFVYFASLAQSVGNEGAGLIKRAALPWVHGTPAEAKLLVAAGLWDEVPDGWQIRNYGTRQVVGMSEQVREDERRAAAAENGRKGAEARWRADA